MEEVGLFAQGGLPNDRTLLIVDDDKQFVERLARAMARQGFLSRCARSVAEATTIIQECPPAFAVVDLRLGADCGLYVITRLCRARPGARAIVLTAYESLTTAVLAVKLGAVDYLPKPADPEQVAAALLASDYEIAPPPENPMSASRVRWEHIQRVYELCDRNVSEAARRLAMHRRTLQRILHKHAPRR